jgi:hypothetical protein
VFKIWLRIFFQPGNFAVESDEVYNDASEDGKDNGYNNINFTIAAKGVCHFGTAILRSGNEYEHLKKCSILGIIKTQTFFLLGRRGVL